MKLAKMLAKPHALNDITTKYTEISEQCLYQLVGTQSQSHEELPDSLNTVLRSDQTLKLNFIPKQTYEV